MKQFFKFMFASLLGFFIGLFLLFFIMAGMLASLASLGKKEAVKLEKNSLLHLTLNQDVADRGGEGPFDNFDIMSFSAGQTIGLNDLLNNLKKAAEDDHIQGILLDLSMVPSGWATIDEIRDALLRFKETGKFIVSYGENYTQKAYYLATVADEILLHPEGMIDFRGLQAESMFFKNMLDRLGIEPQLIRHGDYKSAGEPFVLDRMSPENREQTSAIIHHVWDHLLANIEASRQLDAAHLNRVANGVLTRNATLALESVMIDGIMYRDELRASLNARLDQEAEEDLKLVSLNRYARAPLPKSMIQPRSRDKIAVVYASGSILPGEGSGRTIGSAGMAKAMREARIDTTVKAIVFRINSPGGSALASDVILREVKLAAAEKPVIASMGNVAASGGYYIAVGADKIVASPSTLTGSIGVFGMVPNMQHFFDEKLGVTFDHVKTNELADFVSIHRPLTPTERRLMQEMVEQVYNTFIGHVAEERDMPLTKVDELGGGRVWSGVEALDNGLIDAFGGLGYAIEQAAEMAGLEQYRIVEYPTRKDFLARIMEDFGASIGDRMVERKLGPAYRYYKQIEEINQMGGVLARMPMDLVIE